MASMATNSTLNLPHDWELASTASYAQKIKLSHVWELLGYDLAIKPTGGKIFGCPAKTEFWGMLYVVIVFAIWRSLSVKFFPRQIQGFIEKWLPTTKFIQWHTLIAACIIYEMFKKFTEFLSFDWAGEGLKVWGQEMEIPPLVLTLATYSPFVAVISLIVLSADFFGYLLVAKNHVDIVDVSTGEVDEEHWWWFWKLDSMIILKMLPAWFILMPLYAFIRMWQVVAGSMKPNQKPEDYISLFKADLSLAILVEYLSIFVVAKLILAIFEKGCKEDKLELPKLYWLLKGTSALTVISGLLSALFQIIRIIGFYNVHEAAPTVSTAEICTTQMAVLRFQEYAPVFCTAKTMSPIFEKFASAMLIALTVVMLFACKHDVIKKGLPLANAKFNGAKLIVMMAQVQGTFLVPQSFISEDYDDQRVFFANPKIGFPGIGVPGWNGYVTSLLHVSILQYEILLIAILQVVLWRHDDLGDKLALRKRGASLNKPFLP